MNIEQNLYYSTLNSYFFCLHNNMKSYAPTIQITIKECNNEAAQCAFVIDKIMESTSNCSASKGFGSFAVLYRRQVKLICQYINNEKHKKIYCICSDKTSVIFVSVDIRKSISNSFP